jgi:hypothetical protein
MTQARQSRTSYDKAKYHHETVEEEGLPLSYAANHTVYFLRWIIERDFVSDYFRNEGKDALEGFRHGGWTIHEVYGWWDEVFLSDMLSDEGNAFATAYFDFDKGAHLKDYEETLLGEHESTWHIPYTEENYQKFKKVIDRRYEEWKANPAAFEPPPTPAKPWWKFW